MPDIDLPFFDIKQKNTDRVAFKNQSLKLNILSHFADKGHATISELSKEFNFSSPKIANIINSLIKDGLVKNFGKEESEAGRRPVIYGLNPNCFYFVGAEIKRDFINIGMLNFNKKLITIQQQIPYKLRDTQESLDALSEILKQFIEGQEQKDKIAGIGINLSGRINFRTGHSYSYFHFSDTPLSKVLQQELNIPVFLENDSRAMALGEFSSGIVEDEKNVIFVNIDYGIGAGIMVEGTIQYGKSGFAGEIGHIPIFDNEIICQCGKKGCLETEGSGYALTQNFIKKVKEGHTTIISKTKPNPNDILLGDIIEAAKNDDTLAIELIAQIGEKIGQGIAILINLYNPGLVILGGSLSAVGALIKLPIESAIHKYSLSVVNKDTKLKVSVLGEEAGVIGAGLLVRDKILSE